MVWLETVAVVVVFSGVALYLTRGVTRRGVRVAETLMAAGAVVSAYVIGAVAFGR